MHTTPILIELPNRVNVTTLKRWKANGISRILEENNSAYGLVRTKIEEGSQRQ
jgi:hypothetical protein